MLGLPLLLSKCFKNALLNDRTVQAKKRAHMEQKVQYKTSAQCFKNKLVVTNTRKRNMQNLPKQIAGITLTLILMVFVFSCKEKITGQYNPNQPPETFLFVQTAEDDTLNHTASIQKLYWDGRDDDGFVTGFYFTWKEQPDSADWQWTTKRSMTFPLQITGAETSYVFQIRAVDNDGAWDPTPARQLFPIKNTSPTINWLPTSRIPDTTFTVASFVWQANDLDGDSTIVRFEYALDDTTQWHSIAGYRRNLTLTADSGLTAGEHVFYIRAVDVANSRSPVIRMPQKGTWYVKEPKGEYLLIDDFANEAQSNYPDRYYKALLKQILPEIDPQAGFDYWNIEEQFPASRLQFIETLKLFKRIIWYCDLIQETDEHFITAQVAIPQFLATGGKIIYSVQFNQGFGSLGNPLEFTPVDSLGKMFNFIVTNSRYYPDSTGQRSINELFGVQLPELKVSKIIVGLMALKPNPTAIPMYRFDDPKSDEDPIFVLLGRNDNKSGLDAYDFIFSATPLHYLQGNGNLNEFFKIVFKDIFKP